MHSDSLRIFYEISPNVLEICAGSRCDGAFSPSADCLESSQVSWKKNSELAYAQVRFGYERAVNTGN